MGADTDRCDTFRFSWVLADAHCVIGVEGKGIEADVELPGRDNWLPARVVLELRPR